MTSSSHPDQGEPATVPPKRRALRGRASGARRRSRSLASRLRLYAVTGVMALALLASLGFTVAKPTLTSLVGSGAAAQVPQRPLHTEGTATPAPGRATAGADRKAAMLRREARAAQALAARIPKWKRAPVTVRIGYFNMLGCYHTDHDEPNYGHLARGFSSCWSRLPREFDWLADHGVEIAGVGEFQGKAWRVLADYNSSHGAWGIYPSQQYGPYGQNPVVWRTDRWRLLQGQLVRIPYNCANNGTCRASSTLVLLENRKTKNRLYVLGTHHTSDGGGGGAARRAEARGIELARIAEAHSSGTEVVYMGDFNEVGGARSHLGGSLESAFSGGMGIDQIWGTPGLAFSGTGYDASLRHLGLTDHASGIALTTVKIPGVPNPRRRAVESRDTAVAPTAAELARSRHLLTQPDSTGS